LNDLVRSLRFLLLLGVSVAAVVAVGCDRPAPLPDVPLGPDADADGHTAPTRQTAALNRAVADALPLDDPADFENAERGLIAREPDVVVNGPGGAPIWQTSAYAFEEAEAPASVNPSLWRQAQLNNRHGLYRVTDGVYQVRGYDLANMTIIEGATGWIVVDPLTVRETAAAAWALVGRELGPRPISAVIFTHSHIDHFGGVAGVLSAEEAKQQGVRIIAPAGFMEEATSENVIAGIPMGRRSGFMYGRRLARSPRGHVDSGLGKSPAFGTVGILSPTEWIDRTPQDVVIDGVDFRFQYAPESEAPAELTFYLPDRKAFCGAEVVSRTMHNLYTLRGAKVRDALKWGHYIDEALDLFGDAEVMFASHHWPTWGNALIVDYLEKQRDTYRFIHDQTLRLASSGATPREIAEQLELPASLRPAFANRGYYGTVRHNAKAVYQGYFGWYDGNPANLDPLPPVEEAKRYVEFMGGASEALRKARESFDAGEYRWAATVLDHLVFANPDSGEARALLARTYDQLGYRAESGPWRDVYLTGAYELRHGPPEEGVSVAAAADLLRHTPMERFLEATATRLDGKAADGEELTINIVFTDIEESYVLEVENAVLHHARREPDPDAHATIRVTRKLLLGLLTGEAALRDLALSGELDIDGSRIDLLRFFSLLSAPDPTFAVVTP